jgi:hypothetical protein
MSDLTRTFFHPVLRESTRDFTDGSHFQVDVVPQLSEKLKKENLALEYQVELTSKSVQEQISNGSAKVFLDLYSKETITRILSPLEKDDGLIEFEPGQLLGVLEVQALVIATKEIRNYKPLGINEEYGGIDFDISPGSALAIGEKILLPLSFKRIKLESLMIPHFLAYKV